MKLKPIFPTMLAGVVLVSSRLMWNENDAFPIVASHSLQISTAIRKQATSFWHLLGVK